MFRILFCLVVAPGLIDRALESSAFVHATLGLIAIGMVVAAVMVCLPRRGAV